MRHIGICIIMFISLLFIVYPSVTLSAESEQNITILKYSLKPMEYERSGRFVKARWNLFLVNEAERPVEFVVRIFFIDKFSNKLDEIKKKCKIDANEMKRFQDSILISEPLARRTMRTRVFVDELDEEEPSLLSQSGE